MAVLQVHWLSQGQQLLSTATDGLVKLWNVRTRQCCQTYDEHEDRAWALAVSRDETKVVTGGEDSRLVLWSDVTQQDKQKAQEEADRYCSIALVGCCLVKVIDFVLFIHLLISLSHWSIES